ncbi:MAG: BlaI/MecI/CopY family transcriptional regulator [Planctomycetaceae bacterium]|nr:BlaI/MecI/CopY family transcriptional regulator [Planctomycetaceae bacterium]
MTRKNEKSQDACKISDAEWEVMHVLWEHGTCSAAEVCQTLAGTFDWSPKTIRTFLSRLVQKNIVGVVSKNGINHYVPLIRETAAKQAISRSFLQKFFNGMLPSMVAQFVNNENVTIDELSQLQELIEQRREEIKKKSSRQTKGT